MSSARAHQVLDALANLVIVHVDDRRACSLTLLCHRLRLRRIMDELGARTPARPSEEEIGCG